MPHTTTTVQEPQPLALTGEVLNLRAWKMPDMVVYQHAPEEWWLTPLDDALPLIRLNRLGIELLLSLNGNVTVGWALERFGKWVCGPDGETGRWHLERWSLPRYSLCFFGTEPPNAGRHGAQWDLLLQHIRERWSGREGFEGETHLSEFHLHEITQQDGHFDNIETTVSHLFREPSEAFQGLSYGRLLGRTLKHMGWWTPKPKVVLEVGAGLGYVSREFGAELTSAERQGIRYLFADITRPFLSSQLTRAREGGWQARALHGNAEWLPLRDASVDLVIANENLADLTPVQLTPDAVLSRKGHTPLHQEALDWITRLRLTLEEPLPAEFIFNLGPIRFLSELWRVLKPGGRAILIEFGVDRGWPQPVKLPGHTEYEVQYSHLRHMAKWLGFQEHYLPLPHFFRLRPDTKLLCTGAVYAIQRFCEAEGKTFAVRAYTEPELKDTLGSMLPKLLGCHYHDISDPAWFGLSDFRVLLVEKPGAILRQSAYRETKGFRFYSQGR
ncbi:MAG: class I SAM-dependent methyltransferase [Nitrospirales bacterium]